MLPPFQSVIISLVPVGDIARNYVRMDIDISIGCVRHHYISHEWSNTIDYDYKIS